MHPSGRVLQQSIALLNNVAQSVVQICTLSAAAVPAVEQCVKPGKVFTHLASTFYSGILQTDALVPGLEASS